jgi:hypothetical protein
VPGRNGHRQEGGRPILVHHTFHRRAGGIQRHAAAAGGDHMVVGEQARDGGLLDHPLGSWRGHQPAPAGTASGGLGPRRRRCQNRTDGLDRRPRIRAHDDPGKHADRGFVHGGGQQIAELPLGLGHVNVQVAVRRILAQQAAHLRAVAVNDEQAMTCRGEAVQHQRRAGNDAPLDTVVLAGVPRRR